MEQQRTLTPGATVYDAEGEALGALLTYGSSYIVVEQGFFPADYYIPFEAISASNEDAVYLAYAKADTLLQGWDKPVGADTYGTDSLEAGIDTFQGQTSGVLDQETLTVPVYEEHLEASKQMAQAGEVTITKQVVTEQESIQVPVTEERVRVEWREPTGEVTADGAIFEEGTIEIPVSREIVDVTKRAVQTGEVQVSKEREQRTERVVDSVRREVVEVDDTTDKGLGKAR